VKRDFLNWKVKAELIVGARVVSSRWNVRVLMDTKSHFYAVLKDAISLVDANLLTGMCSDSLSRNWITTRLARANSRLVRRVCYCYSEEHNACK
jgi:hypothetical protein